MTHYFSEGQFNGAHHLGSAKSEENLRKHGVSFAVAAEVFTDDARLEDFDAELSDQEDRWIIIGLAGSISYVLRVTSTDPETGDVRIISARRADRHQVARYLDNRGIS